jgi:pimeloyl-ACP methyl ester carboxylesterase
MATYILVHGACHGGWCWYKVATRLQSLGHKVLTPDLPGSGVDRKPIEKVTLKAYVDHICALIDLQSEPVILVGHSLGGVVMSQVAEYRSEKIKHLFYLAARLLANNESMRNNSANQLLDDSVHSLFTENMVFSPDRSYFHLAEKGIKPALYGMCSDEDITLAQSLLVPQALEPISAIVHLSEKNYGRIPRSYIRTLQDRAIPIAMQDSMLKITPCQNVMTLDTDHSPFFSAPQQLVECLLLK